MKQSELLSQLIESSKSLIKKAEELKILDLGILTIRPTPESWNVLEVLDHLKQYTELYNKQFSISLKKAKPLQVDKDITRSYFGNKFIKMMEPQKDGIKKMKTFKSKNPMGKTLSKSVIQDFIDLNNETIDYLQKSKTLDIQKVKCKLTLPLLKLKVSDAIHFNIAHNQRHFVQINGILK